MLSFLNALSHSIKGRLTYEADAAQEEATLSIDELLHPKSEVLFDELVRRFALNSPLSGVQPKVLAKVRDKVNPLQLARVTPIRGITENLPTGFSTSCAFAPTTASSSTIIITIFFFISTTVCIS
jgi:hypothetical protein